MPSVSNKGDHRLSHIAIIMDGNGRWAQQRGLLRSEGHRQGLQTLKHLVDEVINLDIAYLTLFAFSYENWKRPAEEVSALLTLFADAISEASDAFRRNNIQLRFIGDRSRFPSSLRASMLSLEQLTKLGKRLTLTLAIGYSGRWDILQAAKRLAASMQSTSEESFEKYLATAGVPAPDLLIRTGGEMRISNFMLWQSAYTELYFTNILWPDFSNGDLKVAVDDFYRRERRFGDIGSTNTGDVRKRIDSVS